MNTVYVVEIGDDWPYIRGVFSTEENARQSIREYLDMKSMNPPQCWKISTYDLDANAGHRIAMGTPDERP